MKTKSVVFLVFLVFAIISLSGCVSKIETNIKFNEPPGWKKFVFGGVVTYQHPTDPDTFIQFIPEEEKGPNFRIDDWEETIKIDRENCDKLRIIRIANFTINNLQASEYISECELNGKVLMTRYMFALRKVTNLRCSLLATTKEDYDKNNAIFNRVLESIVWM